MGATLSTAHVTLLAPGAVPASELVAVLTAHVVARGDARIDEDEELRERFAVRAQERGVVALAIGDECRVIRGVFDPDGRVEINIAHRRRPRRVFDIERQITQAGECASVVAAVAAVAC